MCIKITRHFKCHAGTHNVYDQGHIDYIVRCSTGLALDSRYEQEELVCFSESDKFDEYYNHACPECLGETETPKEKPAKTTDPSQQPFFNPREDQAEQPVEERDRIAMHWYLSFLLQGLYALVNSSDGVDYAEDRDEHGRLPMKIITERIQFATAQLACKAAPGHSAAVVICKRTNSQSPNASHFDISQQASSCDCLSTQKPQLSNLSTYWRSLLAVENLDDLINSEFQRSLTEEEREVMFEVYDDTQTELTRWVTDFQWGNPLLDIAERQRPTRVMQMFPVFSKGQMEVRMTQAETVFQPQIQRWEAVKARAITTEEEKVNQAHEEMVSWIYQMVLNDTGLTAERVGQIMVCTYNHMLNLDCLKANPAPGGPQDISRWEGYDEHERSFAKGVMESTFNRLRWIAQNWPGEVLDCLSRFMDQIERMPIVHSDEASLRSWQEWVDRDKALHKEVAKTYTSALMKSVIVLQAHPEVECVVCKRSGWTMDHWPVQNWKCYFQNKDHWVGRNCVHRLSRVLDLSEINHPLRKLDLRYKELKCPYWGCGRNF
ncbi:hypothetical protein B0H63DRAFT_543665 [Podospora didyma]|uniref:Uncharacterized protein n=1 Tax=Podospora didyma TaxID=330526 RepID=A0AAE0TZN4_9PEZI|nr:hypothetical protein B0H63DRAFT_543665 [Podospora didyma]